MKITRTWQQRDGTARRTFTLREYIRFLYDNLKITLKYWRTYL